VSANPIPSLEALAEALRVVALGGRELWGYDEIAAYSKYERNTIVNEIVIRADFPKPIRIGGPKGHPRFIASQVMAWFEKHQET
jgi:predicted DNA-binding transcriptional regulator AlpA